MFKNFKSFLQEAEGQPGAPAAKPEAGNKPAADKEVQPIPGTDPEITEFEKVIDSFISELEQLKTYINTLDSADTVSDPAKGKQIANKQATNVKRIKAEINKLFPGLKKGFAAIDKEAAEIKTGKTESGY